MRIRSLLLFVVACVFTQSLAWAVDMHAAMQPGNSETAHHHADATEPAGSGDTHPKSATGCHVFHCQASAHLGSPSLASTPDFARNGQSIPDDYAAPLVDGIVAAPWRPPTR